MTMKDIERIVGRPVKIVDSKKEKIKTIHLEIDDECQQCEEFVAETVSQKVIIYADSEEQMKLTDFCITCAHRKVCAILNAKKKTHLLTSEAMLVNFMESGRQTIKEKRIQKVDMDGRGYTYVDSQISENRHSLCANCPQHSFRKCYLRYQERNK